MSDEHDGSPAKIRARPGPKPSGVDRSEALKKAAKTHRGAQKEAGRVELKTWVLPDTKVDLATLKEHFAVTTVGEVIDALVQHFQKVTN